MEISSEKSKTMVTSRATKEEVNVNVKVGEVELETVKTFCYLGSIINENVTSEIEIKKRLALATNQLAKLSRIWNSSGISTTIKIKLMKSLIISIILYGCETWTYNKALKKKLAAFEMRCFWGILGITWKQRITNIEVNRRIIDKIGSYEPLPKTARRRKLQWFGHISRKTGTLAYNIMHGSVNGTRSRGWPKRIWTDDIRDWTTKNIVEYFRIAQNRDEWRKLCTNSKCPNGHQAMGVT
eukprot:gene13174-biopygen10501